MLRLKITDIDLGTVDLAKLAAGLKALRVAGVHAGETFHRRKDGTMFPIEYRGTRLLIRGEEFILGIDRDITARKSAEAETRASEELFRLMIETCPDSVLLVKIMDGGRWPIVLCNQRTAVMHGYESADQLVGKAINELTIPQPKAAKLPPFLERLKSQKYISGETVHRRLDGSTFPLEYRACLLYIQGQAHYLAIDRDVSERRQAEAELLQSRKLRAVGEMVGGIAHEFNNLLTPMLVQASIISDSRREDAELVEQMRPIKEAANEARELTQRILTFGRNTPHARERLDLGAVVQDNLAFIRHTLDRRLTVDFQPTREPQWVDQNRSDLNQIILNLTLNARDTLMQKLAAESADGWRPEIVVTLETLEYAPEAKSPGKWRRMSVADNGCGISAENKERIFEPFFTTKGVGVGTGLGLATVWHLVSTMQGWIEVNSVEGEGTSMRVYIPAGEPATGVEPAKVNESVPMIPPRAVAQKPRVLLVEDNEQIGPVLRKMLERRGHVVTVAQDGDLAWKLLNESAASFDLLLTDINLPGRSGIDLVRLVRTQGWPMRALVMGGYMTQEITDTLAELRVDAVIPKPFEMGDLMTAIDKNPN